MKNKAEQQKDILKNMTDRRKKNYHYEDEIEIEPDRCEFGESEFCYLSNGVALALINNRERFKNISGYNGMYLISNYKRIYSRHSNNFLKISQFFDAGETIKLCKKGVQKGYLVDGLHEEHFKHCVIFMNKCHIKLRR